MTVITSPISAVISPVVLPVLVASNPGGASYPPDAMVFVVETTAPDEEVILPFPTNWITCQYDCTVKWGDGTPDTDIFVVGGDRSAPPAGRIHTYAEAGRYTVQITGTMPWISWGYGVDYAPDGEECDPLQLVDFMQWGSTGLALDLDGYGGLSWALCYCAAMVYSATDAPTIDVGSYGVWDGAYVFYGCASATALGGLAQWDVSKLYDLSDAFVDSGLTTPDYDAILIAWSQQSVPSDVVLGASCQYSAAAVAARAVLTGTHNWTITDGGLA